MIASSVFSEIVAIAIAFAIIVAWDVIGPRLLALVG